MSHAWTHSRGNYRRWRALRVLVLDRDNHECQLRLGGCTKVATQVDHMKPWVAAANVTAADLQAACAHCNSKAGPPVDRTPDVKRPTWLT